MGWMGHPYRWHRLHRLWAPFGRFNAWMVLASALWAAAATATPDAESLAPRPVSVQTQTQTQTPARVQVQDGDMASMLAFRLKPRGATIEQMMVALLHLNPGAFLQGNVNLLQGGAMLRLPPPDDVFRISADEARDTVQRHHQSFLSDLEASTKAMSAAKVAADKPTAPQNHAESTAAAEREALLEKLRTAKAHLNELQQNIQELERLTRDEATAATPSPQPVPMPASTPVPESWIWLGVAAIVAVMVGVGASRRPARPAPAHDATQAAAAAEFQTRLGGLSLDLDSLSSPTSPEQPK